MNKICKQVENVLRERREFALSSCNNNLAKARKNSEFCEIEKEEAEAKIKLATFLADENEKEAEKAKKKLLEISKRKETVLKKLGLSEKDLIPSFTCKLCNDTGKDNCKCKNEIKTKLLIENSGIANRLNEKFETAKSVSKEFDLAANFLKQWCEKFPNVTKKTVFLSGQTGIGKTFLAACVVNALIEKGVYAYFTTAFNLNNIFIAYFKAKDEEKDEILQPLLESDVLIIDDLGTEPILNNITLNYLYLVLNERMIAGKSTIINSNLDSEELLNRYGERIFSRILCKRDGVAVKLAGEDLRLKKGKGEKKNV